jgi:two-component system, NarL family, nitrate/nitrite response regulator NarL
LLLDDHALFRESASRLLAAEPGFEVIAHCGTIAEGLQVLRRKAIDVVLLDFDLGESDGRKFLRLAKEQGFQGKVLVVTAGVDAGVAAQLIRAGISGVFRKHDSAASLVQAIRDVMAGKVWLNQEQLQTALSHEAGTPQDNRTQPFTEREPKSSRVCSKGSRIKRLRPESECRKAQLKPHFSSFSRRPVSEPAVNWCVSS